ncbi:MFS transporter [Streptomyces sp. NPDC019937]|uniref:MFS transporter n=1 Tax=Streptomyces sp. NPDC019937 TaxID=3154787 RepID=UPI00340CC67B
MALFTFPRRTDPTQRRSPTGLAGRDFLLLLVATLGTFSNYAPLLSVVSLWSAEGGSGLGGVGAATGVTMATTVGIQLVMGRLLRRYGLRRILAAGALLLGLPTFAYPVSSGLEWVLAVSAVRGVGFGMITVAGSALVAELVPPGRRGRAVGRYGIAVGLPQVVCLPAGVWCAQQFGFTAVFVVTGAVSVLAAPLTGLMSGERVGEETSSGRESSGQGGTSHTPGGLRPLAGPWAMLIVSACALGGMASFLPLTLEGDATAPAALFVLSAAVIVGRWAAGAFNDRAGSGRLLVPGVLACALGTAGVAGAAAGLPAPAVLASVAAGLYGLGFGALQNDTLVMMFHRAGPQGHGVASAVWNMAYDAGTGIGAVAVGVVSQVVGVDGAFAAAAVLIGLVGPLARHERIHETAQRVTPAPAGETC